MGPFGKGWSTAMGQKEVLSAIVGSVIVLLAGCADSSSQEQKAYTPHIDPADFTTTVDNEYFPMKPGTTFIYGGGTERGEMTVTHETRKVMSVECVVVDHKEWDGDELIERTYDWYAQDDQGTVWYFGEETKEYENGEVVSTKGSWEAGVDGAKPGIIMPADPKVGQTYHQEYYPGEAMDMAKVISLNTSVTVPYGSFDHALDTKEWTPLQPVFFEKKYYVRGVGPLGNPRDLGLVDVKHR
jgi:hypothetical protein